MKHFVSFAVRLLVGLSLLLVTTVGHAEQFNIQLGDIISDGAPGPGAGNIPSSTTNDVYTFTATAGQIIFVEELSVAAAFQGWLQWRLTSPSGVTIFSTYFTGQPEGRKVLPETGTYTVRVWVGANNPAYVGNYAFRLRSVPADQTFPIAIGTTVSDGAPAPGAGHLEVAGASDLYTFQALAGQIAFFEEVSVTNSFRGWLQWELRSPSSNLVFMSYFDNGHVGRITFTETGTYRIRCIAGAHDTNYFGRYSFRIRAIPPDDQFAIQIGNTITNGVPDTGAGNIEVAGAEDRYTFTGVAGQDVFIDGIQAAASLGGWLKWELKAPGGQNVFSSFFGSVGRKTLPETGTYTLRCWPAINDPTRTGTYSFRLTPVGDSAFALRIGDIVTNGVPAAGAGRIEDAGGQDFYTFEGVAGQQVNFEQRFAATTFAGYLKWEVKTPAGTNWFSNYFQNGRREPRTLPATGTYTIRVFAQSLEPQHIGTYAFRTWCDAIAFPDKIATSPATARAVPIGTFLCNDRFEPGDAVEVELISTNTAHGGSLTKSFSAITYAPRAGFTGIDTFSYRLRGSFGGISTNQVSVHVEPGGSERLVHVSTVRSVGGGISLCMLGASGQNYLVDESTNLVNWVEKETVSAALDGSLSYGFYTTNGPKRFYRFRKP
ncbi:MAG: hypothetical protein IPK15_09345 [Verrucomicrobia bacterium]|nr:hypothetical protein [Verrucomicrobiota bacterium]